LLKEKLGKALPFQGLAQQTEVSVGVPKKGSSPGPGSYHAKGAAYDASGRALASAFEATAKGSNFGKRSARDGAAQSQTPGPGTYDGSSRSSRVQSVSPSAAFHATARQSPWQHLDTPGAAEYDPHSPRASSSRSPTKREGFLTVSKRFAAASPSPFPGPGSYDASQLSTGACAPFGMRTQSAAGQAVSPGPGSYDPPDQWHNKTFNVLYGEVD